jgi:hypothetical protein
MLLWVTCARMLVSHDDWQTKSDFATNVWLETLAIEDALDEHTCGAEKDTMFMVSLVSSKYSCPTQSFFEAREYIVQ